MIRIILSLLLLGAIPIHAADWITATIHVSTNAPVGNTNNLSINGDTRTFTNSVTGSPATLIQETNSVTWTATNILNHLTSYKANPAFYLSQTASTNVTIRGLVGGAMSVVLAGGWGHVTYSTQTVQTPTYVVRVPVSNEAATNRVIIANGLVDAASDYATSLFDTNAVSLGNFLSKGASPLQTVTAPVSLNALTNSTNKGTIYGGVVDGARGTNLTAVQGTIHRLTGGYWTNAIIDGLTVTNLNSPGSGAGSVQISDGSGSAVASGAESVAIGLNTLAPDYSISLGSSAVSGTNSVTIGLEANSGGYTFATSVGPSTTVTADSASAFGHGASGAHTNSTAIGKDATTTDTNQVRVGTASYTVSIPGVLAAASQTNSVFRGTNKFDGDLALTRRENSSPVNGDNSGVVLGTNVVISITGPTTIGAYAGFASERADSFHFVRFSGAITNIIRNQSGLEATAANRIITGTGADLSLTNEPSWIQIIRNGPSDRWEVIAHSR